tara:strand:+ start:295 stop:492 length:198 start_codon:yes stop_codon:yes gene_type:complete
VRLKADAVVRKSEERQDGTHALSAQNSMIIRPHRFERIEWEYWNPHEEDLADVEDAASKGGAGAM